MSASSSRCPICQGPAAAAAQNPSFPFCGNRCRVVDLSRWLNGDYRVPVSDEDDESPPPASEGPLH